jgi:hypothetical protein
VALTAIIIAQPVNKLLQVAEILPSANQTHIVLLKKIFSHCG